MCVFAVLGDIGDHFFPLKKPWEIGVLLCQFEFDVWMQVAPQRQVWCSRCPRCFSTVEMHNELTSLPWPRSNLRLNCLKESWLVWRNLSGKTCLRCPLVSWKRQVQKVKNKIGRNIRLAMLQANLSDVNSGMICKEHEQRIIKTSTTLRSTEGFYKGAA